MTTMRKIIYTLSLLLITTVSASAQEKMLVHLKDGSTIAYNMSDVDYVELEAPTNGGAYTSDTVAHIGGTVAEAVDLGLSVKWATHNIGSASSSEVGARCSWEESLSNVSLWGEGWRLPSDDEWKELYEKCTWTWTTRDGIGGRLITGPSGKSIFFPASGLTFNAQNHVVGCLGIYWSSTSSAEESANAVGSYFDSANIYRLDFPRSNTFCIRPVKE